jgi:transcriptional regulator with XRE-family HTH domain
MVLKRRIPLTEAKKEHYIGIGLRRLRKERGWTQEELAEKCKLDPRTIQKLERNENSPSLNTVITLAENFDMEPWEFLKNIANEIISIYPNEKEPPKE